MKHVKLALVFVAMIGIGFQPAYSQGLPDPTLPENEVKINIVNTIVVGSLELGY